MMTLTPQCPPPCNRFSKRMRKTSALAIALILLGATQVAADSPYITSSKKSGYQKIVRTQMIHEGWQNFGGVKPYALGGKRSLFFAQLHLTCTKQPDWVKIRLARIHTDGSLDTTGTNTWTLGPTAPKSWQGSLWWESRTWHPIIAQFKVGGGKCYSPQRQFKYWMP